MPTEIQEFPERGEIVLATVTKISDHGAYVSLDEYNGIPGFLHISEIAPGWIRSIGRFVKEGDKKVLLVKKIIPERHDIDLSLKQVSSDQKKKKVKEVKKDEKGKTVLKNIKTKAKLSDKEIEKIEDKILEKYDFIHDAIIDIARNDISVIDDLKLSKEVQDVIIDISSKIRIPSVEIRGILEITSNQSDGVEIIKKTLSDVMKNTKEATVKISYLGAPKYRLSLIGENFKSVEKIMKPMLAKIQESVEKKKGSFNFTREDSIKTREA